MPQTITKGYKELLADADAQVTAVTSEEAKSLLADDSHLFIDIRDIRELRREGKIPGAFSCPRGMLEFWVDPESPYHKPIVQDEKGFVFYCASGWRSALAAKMAEEMGLKPVLHIGDGFNGWKESGGEVEMLEDAKK